MCALTLNSHLYSKMQLSTSSETVLWLAFKFDLKVNV